MPDASLLWELLALGFVVAVVVGVALGAQLRSTRRELRDAHRRIGEMVDPCEDPVAIRLRCLEKELARMPPTVLPSGRRR